MSPRRYSWKSRVLGLAVFGLVFASGLYASAIAPGQAQSPVIKPTTHPTHPTDTGETETTAPTSTTTTGTTATTATTTATTTGTTATTTATTTGTTATTAATTGTTATTATTATTTGTTATTATTSTRTTPTSSTSPGTTGQTPAGTTGVASTPNTTPTGTVTREALGSSGSSSPAARATPAASLLVSPKNGSKIKRPPLFRWVAVRGALYYNLQLYRGGRKVISVWPSHNRYALARSWTYKKHRYRLTRGLYTWFVWPGIGPRAAARYGKLLGKGSFLVVSR